MRVRIARNSCMSFAWDRARALSVAFLRAPLAYSSCTATARSALSIDMSVTRAAESTPRLAMSARGLAAVGMAKRLRRAFGVGGADDPSNVAPQQIHSRD